MSDRVTLNINIYKESIKLKNENRVNPLNILLYEIAEEISSISTTLNMQSSLPNEIENLKKCLEKLENMKEAYENQKSIK